MPTVKRNNAVAAKESELGAISIH